MTTRVPFACALLLALAGCATLPTGPSVMVLPGSRSSFDQFRADDSVCRRFGYEQVGGKSAQQAANEAGVSAAVVGTLVGAAAGAAFNGGPGAAVGAGVGLLTGAAVGSGSSFDAGSATQRRFDNAYVQCMYAHGHQVPVRGARAAVPQAQWQGRAVPPDAATPPPNTPPPARAPLASAPPPYRVPGSQVPPDAATPPPNTPGPAALGASMPAPYQPPRSASGLPF